MTGKFIYVFDKSLRDILLAKNYNLIQSDPDKDLYVFENKAEMKFDMNGHSCLYTDTLTFC